MKSICVVICNYNKQEYVLDAIESVQINSSEIADILVVDNASTDESVLLIRQRFPDIQIDVLPENIGGAGGFAYGMRKAHKAGYRYIALLDNDAIVLPDTLQGMMSVLVNESDIGIVGPAICKMDYPEIVQEVGASIVLEDATFYLHHAAERYSSIPMQMSERDYVPACCLMTRSEVIDQIGVFDESFFLYWDDIDWCVRAKDAGWRVVAQPKLRALHKGGGANATNTLPRYYYWRNKLYFFSKHSKRYPLNDVDFYIKQSLSRNITFQSLNGMDELMPALKKGLNDALLGVTGRYQDGDFPERKNGKQQLIRAMIPPGNYKINLNYFLNSNIPEMRKNNHLCRFVNTLNQFSSDDYCFFIDDNLCNSIFNRVHMWPKCVKNLSEISDMKVIPIIVFPHLYDVEPLELEGLGVSTDIFWNLIPHSISGGAALALANSLAVVQQDVDLFTKSRSSYE